MKKRSPSKKPGATQAVSEEVITSLKEAIAWAGGEDIPVRVRSVKVPKTDARG